jgi:hypothetical protein
MEFQDHSWANPRSVGFYSLWAGRDGSLKVLAYYKAINLAPHVVWKADLPTPTNADNTASFLILQEDCNLVIYTAQSKALWNSGTYGAGKHCRMELQFDGSLTILTEDGAPVWSSRTGKSQPDRSGKR